MENVRFVAFALALAAGLPVSTAAGQSSEMFYYLNGADYYDIGGYTRGPLSESHVTRARIRALRQPPVWLDLDDYRYEYEQPPRRELQPLPREEPVRPSYPYQQPSYGTGDYVPRAGWDYEARYTPQQPAQRDFDSIVREYAAGQTDSAPIPSRVERNGEMLWVF